MATWSSFEKDKLITEGWRDFFKKKENPAGTYPASELTTIVNLISNLAKKLNIDVDTSKIVDEFEAILKSENYNLQEQEDKIMIGGDVPLNLKKTPNLQAFVKAVAQKNQRGLKILLKALGRGAFEVSGYEPAASTEKPKGMDYEPYGATDATPEKRADNLVVKPSFTEPEPAADEEEASTGEAESVPSTAPEEESAEKTPLQTFLDMINKEEIGGAGDKITVELFKNFVKSTKSYTDGKDIPILVSIPDGRLRFKLDDEQIKDMINKSKGKYSTIWRRLNSANRLYKEHYGTLLDLFFEAIQQVANSLAAETPADDKEETATGEVEPTASTTSVEEPAEKTPAETAVDLLNKVDTPVELSTGEPAEDVSIDLFNSFVRDFKSFIQKSRARRRLEEISKTKLAKRFGLNSPAKFDKFFNNNSKYSAIRSRLTFMSMDDLNSFLSAFEQVAKSLPAETPAEPEAPTPDIPAEPEPEATPPEPEVNREPEPTPESEPVPAEEEKPKEKTEDRKFTKRTTKRIKNYYNGLEIGKKLTNKFNIWKEPIERLDGVQSIEKFEFDKAGGKSGKSVESFDTDKDGLYLITLTNGEQFGLPKHTNDVSALEFGFEWDGQIGTQDPLNEVTKLAKIKDGKIIKKGKITWGERGSKVSESILEESLMLRWKTIAGIK